MNYKEIYENIKNNVLPPIDVVLKVFDSASDILILENNVLDLDGSFKVVGDIHGQYYDFLKMLEIYGEPSSTNKYLFLGDYVDRGFNSIEVFFSVLLLKVMHPNDIYILRGNHESQLLTENYTYKLECRLKYNDIVYYNSCEIFTYLPIAAVLNKTIFCVHGGIAPSIDLDFLRKSNRFEEKPVFNDILWSDPGNIDYFETSSRGEGYVFGEKAVDCFLDKHGFTTIIRSHQLVYEGLDVLFNGKVITVWSAPNYSDTKNKAVCLQIEPNGFNPLPLEEANPQYKEDDFYRFLMDYKWRMFESKDAE